MVCPSPSFMVQAVFVFSGTSYACHGHLSFTNIRGTSRLTAVHNFYATLGMSEAYFQIILDENSRDLTAFSDEVTLYRFRRLPFGLSCSPAIFTRHMDTFLSLCGATVSTLGSQLRGPGFDPRVD